jgi:hypothetical protein
MTKAEIYKKSLHQQIGLNFKKKLMRFYIPSLWSIIQYGVETRTLQRVTNTLKDLTRGVGQESRRSVGLKVCIT